MIMQAFINIFQNSVEAMENGGPWPFSIQDSPEKLQIDTIRHRVRHIG
jgi:hypothetical protein